jgi:hypothetical protein
MEELFLPIQNYDNYLVSNYGNIKNKKTNKIKNHCKKSNGYLYISLYKNGISKLFLIHRLVFLAFYNNILNDDVIDHIDGNKTNNNIHNLRSSTFSDNTKNAYKNNEKMKLILTKVYKYDKNQNLLQIYNSINDCKRDNHFTQSKITQLNHTKQLYNNCYYVIEKKEREDRNDTHYNDEEFKLIDDFFGINYSTYSISNYGRIMINKTKTIMKNKQNCDDYNRIILYDNNKRPKTYFIHRIVAYFFVSKYNTDMVINHLDENKLNNYYKNLEITTNKENIRYSLGKQIIQYDLQMNKIRDFSCIKDASDSLNITQSGNIVKCCKNKIKTAYGYIWRYATSL